jgi:dTDP-4-dehydrorhamnose reductase
MKPKQKVLITGGDGFLGSALREEITNHDYEIIHLTRKKLPENNQNLLCDLNHIDKVLDILNTLKPDFIVNLAATVEFGKTGLDKLFTVNVLLPSLFAEYCKKSNAKLIHSSGTIVHGFQNTEFSINTIEAPDTDYGKSKLLADKNILASGCYAAIIRFGGIFGSNGPAHLGTNKAINDAKLGIAPRLVGGGKGLRNYIFVKDAAKAIMTSIDISLQGVFYAGGGETLSIRAMLEHIRDEFIPNKEIEILPGSEGKDQIIETSPEFKNFTKFRDAIQKCR